MSVILSLLLSFPAIIIATTTHEFTRAFVSTQLGDTLPAQKGRLTLNPFKHFEIVGFFLLLVSNGFGWGKPVETSSLYYKNRKQGVILTAVLPSVANLLMGLIFAYAHQISRLSGLNSMIILCLYYCVTINIGLAVYNIVPVYPMDCVKVLSQVLPSNTYYKYLQYEKLFQMLFLLLLLLGVFDFIFTPIINLFITIINLFVFI